MMGEVAEIQQRQVAAHEPESAAIMSMIERVAMSPDADIDKLQKMLDMQERVLDRNARMEFDAAMAQMQPELPEVEKLADGHNSKYAKFDKILAAIKPLLKQYGFSITHRIKVENQLIHVTAILSHKAGHREETTLALPADTGAGKNAVQAVGSSSEYGRRYTMNSLLGIATKDADTDGGKPPSPQAKNQKKKEAITDARLTAAIAKIKSKEYSRKALLENFALTKAQAQWLDDEVAQ